MLASLWLMPTSMWAQKLVVANETIDCGQVAYQAPVVAEYEISNRSNQPMHIEKVRMSCGCTEVDYPKDEIVAGETFSVKVTYDAMTMGHFDKFVDLYLDNADKPLALRMKGVVVAEVIDYAGTYPFMLGKILADRNDIEFDDVNRGEQPQQKIHIRNTTDQTLRPQVMHLPNYLKADVAPTKVKPGHGGVITLTLDSRSLPEMGLNQTSVFLGGFPGDKVSADKEITISAVLLPNFEKLSAHQLAMAPKIELSEMEVNLPPFGKKKKQRAVIHIRNVGKSVLDIRNLRMFTSALQVSLNTTYLAPGAEAKLKITVDAAKLKEARNKPRVLMITNDPDNAKVTININVQDK